MNTKKILAALFASVVAGAALTFSAMAAELTATTEEELAAVLESAEKGDTITVEGEFALSEKLVIGDGIRLVAPGVSGNIYAENGAAINVNAPKITIIGGKELTFTGDNIVLSFDSEKYYSTINIIKGATVELMSTSRMPLGYGNTYNIIGNIDDAKTVNVDEIKPSLKAAGASISGSAGITFNVTDAYINFTYYVSTKKDVADGTFEFNIDNSVWNNTNKISFDIPVGKNPKIIFNAKDSVINTTSHLVFAVEDSEVVFDNSYINYENGRRQLENRGVMTIKNGSIVHAAVASSSNATNPGTIIVDNATYDATGEFTSAAETGKIIVKNNATATVGSISKSEIVVENGGELETKTIKSSNLEVDGSSQITATAVTDSDVTVNLKNAVVGNTPLNVPGIDMTTVAVKSNGVADVETNSDGTITIKDTVKAVVDVDGEHFADLVSALKSVEKDSVVTLLDDITITEAWDCRNTGAKILVPVTIDGNNKTLKFSGAIDDKNWNTVFRFEEAATVKDLTIDVSEATGVQRGITAKGNITVENFKFIGNGSSARYGVIFGEGAGTNIGNVTATITNSEFANCSYGVSDNRNDQDAAAVTVTGSTFTNAKVLLSAKDTITFSNNTVTNAGVTITSYSDVTILEVTATGNTLDSNATNYINANKIETDSEIFDLPAADINGKKYISIAEAISKTVDGDVVTILPGTHENFPSITKSIVLTGDPNYGTATLSDDTTITKPVINISDVTNGGVKYEAAKIVFDNLVFNVLEDATGAGWNVSALGYYYENTADRNGLTVTNCDFINNSDISMSAIAANIATYTVKNNTFKNFTTMVHSFVDHGALGIVEVSGNTFTNVENIVSVYWGAVNTTEAATLTVKDNKSTDGSTAKIIVDDFGKTKADPVTAIPTATISGNDGELKFHNYTSDNTLTTDEPMTNYYRTYEIAKALDGKLPNGVVYVVYYTNDAGNLAAYETPKMYIVEEHKIKDEAETVELVFVPNTTYDANALENSVWDLVLVANEAGIINRLNSADFTFELTTDEEKDAMAYEIIATNDEVVINNVNNDANRYEFHYDGKTGTITDTATKIKIGTVKFTGYGAFTFSVDTAEVAENTNQVHTTTFVDNIVDSFVVGGVIDADGNVTNELKVNNTIDSEIIVPTKTLTINIDFPNSVSDNAVAYQQMKVVVSGGELEAPLTIDLGTDYVVSKLDIYDNKANVAVSVTKNNPYAIVITNLLEVNTAYNVEVSGEGYRTAKYTVTMTEDKTLNFWNNVKDNAVNVEEDKASSAKNVTFLAGDIVKDSIINVYDLSAVVSYFGEIKLVEDNKTQYAKYDLNRDGKIDSKDVAYVLVSWGK